MQPKNNASTTPPPANPPATTPMNPGGDIVFKDKPKKNTGMIIGMIFLALLAAGGIGFGIWAYLDGNQKTADLNNQISDLQNQLVNSGTTNIDETDITESYKNPIIKSSDTDEEFRVGFRSSYYYGDDNINKVLEINIKNGAIDTCRISNVSNGATISNCEIIGVNGDIYRVIEFGEGQDNSNSNIGFIMTDGTIQYFPFIESMKNNSFNAEKKLNVDGQIIDAIEIAVGPTNPNVAGGYGSTVFVLSDGSFVKFNESML